MPMSPQDITLVTGARPSRFAELTPSSFFTADLDEAAFAGLDRGELVSIPALPDTPNWDAYEAARRKLIPNLSLSLLLARYRVALERDVPDIEPT